MIGNFMLVALQIHTWNDQRVKKSESSTIYVSVMEELENDIKILNEYLPSFYIDKTSQPGIINVHLILRDLTIGDLLKIRKLVPYFL